MGWEKRALCPCGMSFRAAFAKLFFVREECCPRCGADKDSFSIETVRWVPPVRDGWKFWRVIEPGRWEIKQ